jgi:tight adherence protein B
MVTFIGLMFGVAVALLVNACQSAIASLLKNYQQTYENKMQQGLTELFLFVPVRQLITLWGITTIAVMFGMLAFNSGWLTHLLGLLIFGAAPWYSYQYLRKQRARSFQQQLPDALLLIANSLRSGASLQSSMHFISQEMPAPIGQEFSLLLRQLRLGHTLDAALTELEHRLPSIDCTRMVAAISLGQGTGGQQAPLLERLAGSMRKKQHLQQRMQSLSAQGRMQGRVMTILPVFLTLVLWAIEKNTVEQLMQHPLGWLIATSMVFMLTMGQWLINKMLRIQVPL